MTRLLTTLWGASTLAAVLCLSLSQRAAAQRDVKAAKADVVDLSLLVAPELPCTWPADWFPLFQLNPYRRIGPLSAYNSEVLSIDGNTGTQLDFPPHSVA